MSKLILPVSDRDHIQGDTNARVTLVEYGDYQCPYCGQAYPIVMAIQRRLGSHLRFVFRNFPLREAHPFAEGAAEAAEAAGSQGKFWEMHDLLFENQDDLEGESLVRYAQGVIPDVDRWVLDINERAFRERVDEDLKSGIHSGVNGTPTFFINGVRHETSFDEATLEQAIRAQPRESGD